jgi:hypothetical protein
MADLATLKTQIASDLRRSNLTTEIATAILDAIQDHGAERFYFNDTARYDFNTVNGTDVYAITAQAPIQEFVKIDLIRAQLGSWYDVKEENYNEIERLYSTPSSGQPFLYAVFGNSLRLFPLPNAVYPIRVFGHYRLIPLTADTQSNSWTTEAKNLIRYSVLKRLFMTPIRDATQAQYFEAAEVRELEYLRRETERRARKGRMEPYYG